MLAKLESKGIALHTKEGVPILPSIVQGKRLYSEYTIPVETPIDNSLIISYQSPYAGPERVWDPKPYSNLAPTEAVSEELLDALEGELAELEDALVDAIVLDTGKTLREARLEMELTLRLLRRIPATRSNKASTASLVSMPSFTMPLYTTVHSIVEAYRMESGILVKPPRKAPIVPTLLAQVLSTAGYSRNVSLVQAQGAFIHGVARAYNLPVAAYASPMKSRFIGDRVYAPGRYALIVEKGLISEDLAKLVVYSRVLHAGQACGSIGWIVILGGLPERSELEALFSVVEKVKVGDPLDSNTTMGPLVSSHAANASESYTSHLEEIGGSVITGFRRYGNYVWPTIVQGSMKDPGVLSRDPKFPVLSIIKSGNLAEALSVVTLTPSTGVILFGLNSSEAARAVTSLQGRHIYVEPDLKGIDLAPGSFTTRDCINLNLYDAKVQIGGNPLVGLRGPSEAEPYR